MILFDYFYFGGSVYILFTNPTSRHNTRRVHHTPIQSIAIMSRFNEMDVALAMTDLKPHIDSRALEITTQMNLEGVPIAAQDPWVKGKLLACANGGYWKLKFEKAAKEAAAPPQK